jgi:hypothetical protein
MAAESPTLQAAEKGPSTLIDQFRISKFEFRISGEYASAEPVLSLSKDPFSRASLLNVFDQPARI